MKLSQGNFFRLPDTDNHTLQAWNAADELLVKQVSEELAPNKHISIFNDRFGYLTCHFSEFQPEVWVHLKSQKDAIEKNLSSNQLPALTSYNEITDSSNFGPWDTVIMHIPKSLGLWEWFLQIIHQHATEQTKVYCGFMTRHFTPSWLELAHQYFGTVSQSRAEKKARLLMLEHKKEFSSKPVEPIKVAYKNTVYYQFPGVFAYGKTDPATMFLLENLSIRQNEKKVLDWGCGSGIIASELQKNYGPLEITAKDDYLPAVASSKLNLPDGHIVWDYKLDNLPQYAFDLIITNPPFHFEYENDFSVSLKMFEKSISYLTEKGRLVIVANTHLNYKTHLEKIFPTVLVINRNEKFVIYECHKFS